MPRGMVSHQPATGAGSRPATSLLNLAAAQPRLLLRKHHVEVVVARVGDDQRPALVLQAVLVTLPGLGVLRARGGDRELAAIHRPPPAGPAAPEGLGAGSVPVENNRHGGAQQLLADLNRRRFSAGTPQRG